MRGAELGSLVLVGALWGGTNSFLRPRGADGGEAEAAGPAAPARGDGAQQAAAMSAVSAPTRLARHLAALARDWRFTVPFVVNQSGSLLYYLLLGTSELSLAVPICNASTFVFTLLTSRFVRGEKQQGDPLLLFLGVICIVVGVGLMSLPSTSPPEPAQDPKVKLVVAGL